jgi:anti-sigma-K factor RskA
MNESKHERWQEDVAAYMLGALEPARATELEQHLESCERCQAEVRWLTPALNALPQSVERQQPPPELRTRILAEVGADARRAGGESAAAADGPLQRLGAWLRGLGSGPMGLRPVVGLAAAVLVVVAVAGYAIGGGIGGGDDGSDGGSTVVAGKPPGVTAKVVMKGNGGTLHLTNVKQLHDEHVLEAWVQREGEVEPVQALFVPDDKGRASTAIADMEGVEVVMVTTEPRGGSEAPTSSPIVTVPIPQ